MVGSPPEHEPVRSRERPLEQVARGHRRERGGRVEEERGEPHRQPRVVRRRAHPHRRVAATRDPVAQTLAGIDERESGPAEQLDDLALEQPRRIERRGKDAHPPLTPPGLGCGAPHRADEAMDRELGGVVGNVGGGDSTWLALNSSARARANARCAEHEGLPASGPIDKVRAVLTGHTMLPAVTRTANVWHLDTGAGTPTRRPTLARIDGDPIDTVTIATR